MAGGGIDGVGTGGGNQDFGDFEILDDLAPQGNPQVQPQGGAPAAEAQAEGAGAADHGGFGDVEILEANEFDGNAALQGAQVGPGAAPQTLAGRLREIMPERHTFGNWVVNAFKALGRTFMGIHHKIWGFKQMNATQADALKNITWGTSQSTILPALENENAGRTVCTFSAEEVGNAFGLRQSVWQPFPDSQGKTARQIAYPNGVPMLADIKQDPDLQDCWFLSSLGAMLVAGGSYAIERLIELPADPNAQGAVARVKLGDRYVYEVPFAEIRGNNGSKGAISHSEPWVKILEQAMQMHRLKTTGATEPGQLDWLNRQGVKMAYGDPRTAFTALMGTSRMPDSVHLRDLPNPREKLAALVHQGHPVVLGSPDSNLTALSTGISPGHAVTFIDFDPDTGAAMVLDPYGKIKTVPLEKLQDFTVVSLNLS